MDKNKNVIAGFLMLVGVVFVLIAGGVFVTTAWVYLPEIVKQFFIFILTAAFFGTAYCLRREGKLAKTEFALYYLGVAFCGYCCISFLGGCHFPLRGQSDAGRLLMASLLMLVPVSIRLVTEYRQGKRGLAFHMAVLLILLDSALVWGFVYCNLGCRMRIFVAAGTLLAYALADCFGKGFWREYPAIKIVFYIEFLLHVLAYALLWCGHFGYQYSSAERLALAFMILLTAYVMWESRKQAVWRIFHSLMLLWFVMMLVLNVQDLGLIPWGGEFHPDEVVLFVSYIVCMLLMLVMQRPEMIWIIARFAPAMAFIQLIDSVFGRKEYLPFALVCMAGLILLPLAVECKSAIGNKNEFPWQKEGFACIWKLYAQGEGKQYLMAGILQIVSAGVLARAFYEQDHGEQWMFFWLLLTLGMAVSALISKYRWWSQILWTLALIPGMCVFWTCPWVQIPAQFTVEYGCIWAELAVVLLGCIWYDKDKRDIGLVQFILNCMLLGILLLWNLCSGDLANALLLGGVSMFIILLAAVFHRKNYILAGAVSLFLLVVYATRALWLNIAWWVYLLIAGVVLIILASHAFSKGEVED